MTSPSPLNAFEYFEVNGAFPSLGNSRPPWCYRGWLLAVVQGLHGLSTGPASQIPDRWGYLLRTLEAGHLLEEPIPTLSYHRCDPAVMKAVEKALEPVQRQGRNAWEAFREFIGWLGWGLGVSEEYPRIPDKAQEALYREVDLGPWLLTPYDYLGEMLAAAKGHGKAWNPLAFYPTPHSLCDLSVRLIIADALSGEPPPDLRLQTAYDPAMGTGRLLLHAGDHCMRLAGQDLDSLVLLIAKINGALYCPWLVCPLPADVGPAPRAEPPGESSERPGQWLLPLAVRKEPR